jgi:hypothetical protein
MADGESATHTLSTPGNEILRNDFSGELEAARIDMSEIRAVAFSNVRRRIVTMICLTIMIKFVTLQYSMKQ